MGGGISRGIRGGVVAGLLGLSLLAAAPASTRTARGGEVVVSGHGFGHGIGLSQWGAEERAAAGWRYPRILAFYYPGTTLAPAPARRVRVLLAERPTVLVGSARPFTIRGVDGSVARLPAGRYRAGSAIPLPATVLPDGAPLELGGTRYAGSLRLDRVGGKVRAVNELDLEDYLVGVVSSECPGYWHADALRAQAVASRSYALANLRPGADFDLYPDDRSQNYHGLLKHLPAAEAAVRATRGEVLRYRGAVVNALFSAANGGLTSVADGVWTGAPPPYFAARTDTFDAKSPETNWGPLRITASDLRASFPELPAVIAGVSLERNAGRRVTRLTFTGADGSTVSIGGYAFQQRLGLRSTYYDVDAAPYEATGPG